MSGSSPTRWLAPFALSLVVAACGGASGDTPLADGSGSSSFGSGAGTPPFGTGSGGGSGATGDGPRPDPDAPVVISNDDLQGNVFDASTGDGLGAATVAFDNTTITVASDGSFALQSVAAAPRAVLQTAASNYETLLAPTEMLGTVPSVNLLRLTPRGTSADITVASGGTVTQASSGATLDVPAGALSATNGGATPATVAVRVTSIGVASDPHLLSGDYTDANGAALEAFGAVTIGASDAIEVSPGQQLSLAIPVSTRNPQPPSTATLYLLDPTSARWVAQGSVSVTSGAYRATVSEFGQYMVGAPIDTPVAVNGCVVEDTGQAAANVRMEVEGVGYSGTAQATTDAQGNFSLPARAASRVIVSGRRGAYLTNAAARDVPALPATSLDVTPCLTLPTTNAATVRLTWGAAPRDIDSHLRTPDGSHVYFASSGSLTQGPFANLDVDDVTGFGPEVTTIRRPKVGIYRFYLYNYSGTFSPGMTGSPTRVELNYAGHPVVFTPPAGEGTARYWHLFDLYIASDCTMTLYRYNRWRADEPQNPNSSSTFTTATECVPG